MSTVDRPVRTVDPGPARSLTPGRAAALSLGFVGVVTVAVNAFVNIPHHDDLVPIDVLVAVVNLLLGAVVFGLAARVRDDAPRARRLLITVLVLMVLTAPVYWLVVHPVLGTAALLLTREPRAATVRPSLWLAGRILGVAGLLVGIGFVAAAAVHYYVH